MAINVNSKVCDTCHKSVSTSLFNTRRDLNTTTCFNCRSKGFGAARERKDRRKRIEDTIKQQNSRLFLPTVTRRNRRKRTDNDRRLTVFLDYIEASTKRGKSFLLTIDQFYEIKAGACSYCGKHGPNGIDRVNNKIGYEPGNCVPCCKKCNMIKFNMSVDDFVSHCYAIVQHRVGV